MAETDKSTSIPKSGTIEEMAEFWDTHDVTDFDDETHEVEMDLKIQFRSHYVAIDPDLLLELPKAAKTRGLKKRKA